MKIYTEWYPGDVTAVYDLDGLIYYVSKQYKPHFGSIAAYELNREYHNEDTPTLDTEIISAEKMWYDLKDGMSLEEVKRKVEEGGYNGF